MRYVVFSQIGPVTCFHPHFIFGWFRLFLFEVRKSALLSCSLPHTVRGRFGHVLLKFSQAATATYQSSAAQHQWAEAAAFLLTSGFQKSFTFAAMFVRTKLLQWQSFYAWCSSLPLTQSWYIVIIVCRASLLFITVPKAKHFSTSSTFAH